MSGCCGPGAPNQAPLGIYEGAWASQPLLQNLQARAPFRSAMAGVGAWRAIAPGTIQGRFGWGDPSTGLVANTRQTEQDALGMVIPLRSLNGSNGGVVGGPRALAGPQAQFTWEYWDPTVCGWRVRSGLVITLHSSGNFWVRFLSGALAGNQVYASLVDGSAISGPASNAEATPWQVCYNVEPGQLGQITTTAHFNS